MKKKIAIKYFTTEWQDMRAQLHNYLETLDQEDLHRFRVQVKKLKALLVLCSYRRNGRQLKGYFKPVKNVFQQAGELRNAYISGKMDPQAENLTTAMRNLRSCAVDFLKCSANVRRRIKKRLRRIRQRNVRRFYEKQLRFAAGVLSEHFSAERLHECRKRIKLLRYNYPLVRGELPFRLDTAYLDELQEAIGQWHDHWLAGSRDPLEAREVRRLSKRFKERVNGDQSPVI